ncbi:GNAT family N-acetyltransferase [Actinoplanes sp. NEAU-A12]|uniref:GNAT family N-acetyltransferase n=1 Tax=Actinoplanes sandaracinus TaxID=3045177 RepID=A0ABT6WXY2_9ACTN|nr:GNAT family N-acetyltransferase [Actinoplanes sandaracinus]MDI6104612.1 GNAT family N-acetyltransferase [Actinoplanes sandaracinus]
MTTPTIRIADGDDVPAIGALIAHSFDDLGPNHFLVPDAVNREAIMASYFAILAGQAVDGGGEVLMLEDAGAPRAVAVWFDRSGEPAPFDDYDRLLEKAVGPYLPRFRELDGLLDKHHPAEPHAHLAFLAVQPGYQGRGFGGRLLAHAHSRFQGSPWFLEATNPRNRALYLRHGYVDMEPATILLSDGTPFYLMWRSADS